MANEQNLKRPTAKEARELGRKGGKASAEARRRKKTLREMALLLGSLPVTGKTADQMAKIGIDADDQTRDTAILLSLQTKAMQGDVQAAKLYAQMQGASLEKVELTGADGEPIKTENKVILDDVIAALKSKD